MRSCREGGQTITFAGVDARAHNSGFVWPCRVDGPTYTSEKTRPAEHR